METGGREKFIDEAEKIVRVDETDDEAILNLSLRPKLLKDFIGQGTVVEPMDIALEASIKRDEPLEHLLFSGPPGLGKTSLAYIIAGEMGRKVTATSGPAIDRAGDLIGILTNLSDGDILFIDEIHRLSKVVEEFIYPAMENFQIDFLVDKGPYAKTVKFNLKRFTLIGATTRAGLLSAPLRDRFGMFFHLEFYSIEDLSRIIKRSAKILDISIDDDGARELAACSRGTPRIANRLLRRVRDWVEVKSDGKITRKAAIEALSTHGIDSAGLDRISRRVLEVIFSTYKRGPVGIEAIAASLNEEVDTIQDVIEPYLLKMGFLRRTSRGRELTDTACEYLGKKDALFGELFKTSKETS
ncbi:MAG: Holliday junction branch migration DNA helicase RuvB [Candidatus Omnitrophica bacterium]|nr:Holliday junction branch migration DNA helicase RuvB [Candidatus Omnitrophota bacterium]